MAGKKIIKIEIVCTNRNCGKCKRLLERVQEAERLTDDLFEIAWIDEPHQWSRYDTWVAPALFFNGQTVARGYVPPIKRIMEFIMEIQKVKESEKFESDRKNNEEDV